MLVDHQIAHQIDTGKLIINPWDPTKLQPASVDLTLDNKFRIYRSSGRGVNRSTIDVRSTERRTKLIEVSEGASFRLPSLGFALASTIECVTLPNNMIGRLEGKSSLARMGLFVHVTAGFFDPGFSGYCTLELFNAAPFAIDLIPGMPICQMGFDLSAPDPEKHFGSWGTEKLMNVSPPARNPYSGKYMNQERGPQESMYYKNFPDAEG